MNLVDLLRITSLPISEIGPASRIKLVRHSIGHARHTLFKRNPELFHIYQAMQGNPVFENCDYVISFLAYDATKAEFFGIYRNKGQTDPKDFWKKHYSTEYEKNIETVDAESIVAYDFEPLNFLSDLRHRLIIEWGKSTIRWHQWLSPKEVVEILPEGYVREFPGCYNLILEYDELQKIFTYPDTYRIWHQQLSSVSGIYMILDTKTGDQYIGSAYGQGGLLGRWEDYAKNGHGGNKSLKYLVESNPGYQHNFRLSVLRVLDKTLPKDEVIRIEEVYKIKLGSKVFGLNN